MAAAASWCLFTPPRPDPPGMRHSKSEASGLSSEPRALRRRCSGGLLTALVRRRAATKVALVRTQPTAPGLLRMMAVAVSGLTLGPIELPRALIKQRLRGFPGDSGAE